MPIHSNGVGPRLEGTVTVIGAGGMFIRTRDAQPYGETLKLIVEDSLARFDAECTVRHVEENGLGVEITKITPENEQRLRVLLLRLKR